MITLEQWREFADAVEAHIRDYTIPQYGDYPHDQMSTFTDEDIKTSIARYENRRGKGARGIAEEMRDCLKIAHYCQCLYKREAPRVAEWRRCADILAEVIEDGRDLTGSIGQACEHWHKLRKEHNVMQRVRIKRIRENAVTPGYKHVGDSGFDLTACETVEIPPHETRSISLGWAFEIPEGLEIQIRPRSGVSRDTPALVITGTVDSSYRGEVSAIVHNRSNSDMVIYEGKAICQGVLAPVLRACFKECPELGETVRGAAGFGSTGV